MPKNPTEAAPAAVTTPDIDALESAFLSAKVKQEAAETEAINTARSGADLDAIQTAMKLVAESRTATVKAENSWKSAKFTQENRGRLNAAVVAHDFLKGLTGEPAIANAFALGIVGIHIAKDSEGNINVTVNSGAGKAPKVPGAGKGAPRGPRTTKRWSYNGAEYTSRELLTELGGEAGAEAINRYDNWEALGLKYNPGFDGPVKKLAGEIGAVDLRA